MNKKKDDWIKRMQIYGLHTDDYAEVTVAEIKILRQIKPVDEALKDVELAIRQLGLEDLF
ncbi:hypothetical protein A3L12_03605 [Thermococcus sp. P6]|uniref:hypothetical protein n=1 Tax=Thermococcus sp. P6 TaxID=122420 RepID=UPI000B59D59E|nr:hypothetical protein [Thermococcus sp. P6]ASJ10449.1 hypothetical protein A3L12_03605 [Thermococcus sp. P6]